MNERLGRYLNSMAQARGDEFDEFDEMCERLDWMERRLNDLETALPLYRLDDTTTRSGVARKLSELSNTISKIVYRRAAPKQEENLAEAKLAQFVTEFMRASPTPQDARIYMDMTGTLRAGYVTGIQRVVRELARRGGSHGIVPIFLESGQPVAFDQSENQIQRVEFKRGDLLVMANSTWNYAGSAKIAMDKMQAVGGSNVALIFDLIPLLLPGAAPSRRLARHFQRWFDSCALACNGLVCISRSVAADVENYIAAKPRSNAERPWVDWFHLGCDLNVTNAAPSASIRGVIGETSPYFLSVSTIEPRKAHGVVIDAMEELWRCGSDARLVIVGRYGWRLEDLKDRILSHRELDGRLFWLPDVTDSDLQHLYRNARALISASVAEGFGLPIQEAAHFGLPAIASDIPVYREIAGDDAAYFQPADSDGLIQRLKEALAAPKRAPSLRPLNWDEAASQFFSKVQRRAGHDTGAAVELM